MGLIDFAGGTVVHVTAGVAALVTAIILGPRKDFLSTATLPHNLSMSFTGAATLWLAGSALMPAPLLQETARLGWHYS